MFDIWNRPGDLFLAALAKEKWYTTIPEEPPIEEEPEDDDE